MTQYHNSKAFRKYHSAKHQRFRRPLIVLTYHDNQLVAIHSSTPTVQFVRLDVVTADAGDTTTWGFPSPTTARLVTVASLAELPADRYQAAQRAFRTP